MRRTVGAFLVVLTLSSVGCASRASAVAGIVAGGVVIATSVTVRELSPTRSNDKDELDLLPSGYDVAIGLGTIVVLVSLVSLVVNANQQSPPSPTAAAPPP